MKYILNLLLIKNFKNIIKFKNIPPPKYSIHPKSKKNLYLLEIFKKLILKKLQKIIGINHIKEKKYLNFKKILLKFKNKKFNKLNITIPKTIPKKQTNKIKIFKKKFNKTKEKKGKINHKNIDPPIIENPNKKFIKYNIKFLSPIDKIINPK